ncbi:MAG: Arm DNA-binding domain-containing protein [Deltaproteobacteria bacterium]|nr:Arm DNA-binding domain-containing protein [Deltaproteobacteria bacterium]
MALTDLKSKGIVPEEKDKAYFDQFGLYLLARPSGLKTWRLKCFILPKPLEIKL